MHVNEMDFVYVSHNFKGNFRSMTLWRRNWYHLTSVRVWNEKELPVWQHVKNLTHSKIEIINFLKKVLQHKKNWCVININLFDI